MARTRKVFVPCALAAVLLAVAATTAHGARPTPASPPTWPSSSHHHPHPSPAPPSPVNHHHHHKDGTNPTNPTTKAPLGTMQCNDGLPAAYNSRDLVGDWSQACDARINACGACDIWFDVVDCVKEGKPYCSQGYHYSMPDKTTGAWIIQGTKKAVKGIESIQAGPEPAVDGLWKQAWDDALSGDNRRPKLDHDEAALVINSLHARSRHNLHIHGQKRSAYLDACVRSLKYVDAGNWADAKCAGLSGPATSPAPIRYTYVHASDRADVNKILRNGLKAQGTDVLTNGVNVGAVLVGAPNSTGNYLIVFDAPNIDDYTLALREVTRPGGK
jgi:hypothetical protein